MRILLLRAEALPGNTWAAAYLPQSIETGIKASAEQVVPGKDDEYLILHDLCKKPVLQNTPHPTESNFPVPIEAAHDEPLPNKENIAILFIIVNGGLAFV